MTAIDLGTSLEYGDGRKVSGIAHGAAVLAKRLVTIAHPMATSGASKGLVPVAYTGAGAIAHYWVRQDADAEATVSLLKSGRVVCTASAAITAPAPLMAAANGKVAAATDDCQVIGYALTDAAADGDDVVVDLNLPGYPLIDVSDFAASGHTHA